MIVKNIISYFVKPSYLALLLIIFIINYAVNVANHGLIPSPIEQTVFNFYGPTKNLMGFMIWLTHQLPIILSLHYMFNKELSERVTYKLSRVRNLKIWFNSLIFTSFILVFIYYTLGFILTMFLSYINVKIIFKDDVFYNSIQGNFFDVNNLYGLLLSEFILLIIGTILLALTAFLLTILFRNAVGAITFLIIYCYLSFLIHDQTLFVSKMLPFTNVYLRGHNEEFTIYWSLGYLVISVIVVLFLLKVLHLRYIEKTFLHEGENI